MCWLEQSSQLWHYPTFLLWPLLLLAGIECFAGYHAWRLLLGINGAVLGFIAGASLSILLGNPLLLILGTLAGVAGGAALFALVVPLGSGVFAFGTAASLTILLWRLAGLSPNWSMPVAVIAGLVGAYAVLTVHRPARIVLAAIGGAQQLVSAWGAYRTPPDAIPLPDVLTPTDWTVFLACAAAGLLTQFATSRPAPLAPQSTASSIGSAADG